MHCIGPAKGRTFQSHKVPEADGSPSQQLENELVDNIEELESKGLDPAFALRHRDIHVLSIQCAEQIGNGGRQILAIRVHHHYTLRIGQGAFHIAEPNSNGLLVPHIAAQRKHHAIDPRRLQMLGKYRLAQ